MDPLCEETKTSSINVDILSFFSIFSSAPPWSLMVDPLACLVRESSWQLLKHTQGGFMEGPLDYMVTSLEITLNDWSFFLNNR